MDRARARGRERLAHLGRAVQQDAGSVSSACHEDTQSGLGCPESAGATGEPRMIVHDVAQRSEAWAQLRLGRLSASRAGDMLATLKSGGEAASRRDLRVQLVLERLTNQSQENGYI